MLFSSPTNLDGEIVLFLQNFLFQFSDFGCCYSGFLVQTFFLFFTKLPLQKMLVVEHHFCKITTIVQSSLDAS